jgi:hypothetical protein
LCIPDDSGLIRFLLSGDIHPIAFLGNRSPILLTCPYLMSWSYWAASTIVTFRPIICSIFRSVFSPFKIFRTICVASPFSSAADLLLPSWVHLHTSDPYNTILFITVFIYIKYYYIIDDVTTNVGRPRKAVRAPTARLPLLPVVARP